MQVDGKHYRTIWSKKNKHPKDLPEIIQIIDQRKLPHDFVVADLETLADTCVAIKDMAVRGAGLIGATAAYGMYLAAKQAPEDNFSHFMVEAGVTLKATRPTAVNLAWAVDRQLHAIHGVTSTTEAKSRLFKEAEAIADEDAMQCKQIGEHGFKIIEAISKSKNGATVNVLTHCNAGWLAFVDYGTATAPIYTAFERGIDIHVWVDETRPRNQGASLTSWELTQAGVPCHLIVDNVSGHLMQHGLVDLVITGSDRTTYTGDVCNKIGTYKTALAAKDNNIPFYAAVPTSTLDWEKSDGLRDIPIEERDQREVTHITGRLGEKSVTVQLAPTGVAAKNFGFDVTPRRLVTGIITDRGICSASKEGILKLYPDYRNRVTSTPAPEETTWTTTY